VKDSRLDKYPHCPDCIKEVDNIKGMSPRNYARIEFCITDNGFEVKCIRHEKKFYDFNIVDFCEFYLSENPKENVRQKLTTH